MNEKAKRDNPEEDAVSAPMAADAGNVDTEPVDTEHKVELTVLAGTETAVSDSMGSTVKQAQFAPLGPSISSGAQGSLDLLLDVQLDLTVELGQAVVPVREVLQLGPGSVVELNKLAGEPVDILVNGKPIARGEVVVIDENFGVRVTEITSQTERLRKLS